MSDVPLSEQIKNAEIRFSYAMQAVEEKAALWSDAQKTASKAKAEYEAAWCDREKAWIEMCDLKKWGAVQEAQSGEI